MSRQIQIVEQYKCVSPLYAIERNGQITPVPINDCSDDELAAVSSIARQRFESAGGGPGDTVEAGQLRHIIADRKEARERGEVFTLTTKFVEAE